MTLSRSTGCPMIHATIEVATEQQGRPTVADTSLRPSTAETRLSPMAMSGAMCRCAVNTRSRGIDSDIKLLHLPAAMTVTSKSCFAFASRHASDRAKAMAFASSVKVAEGAVAEAKAATWQKQRCGRSSGRSNSSWDRNSNGKGRINKGKSS